MHPTNEPKREYSTNEVARAIGCHRVTVFRAINSIDQKILRGLSRTPDGRIRLTIEDARTLASVMGRDPKRVEVLLIAA